MDNKEAIRSRIFTLYAYKEEGIYNNASGYYYKFKKNGSHYKVSILEQNEWVKYIIVGIPLVFVEKPPLDWIV
jgi:hypothetical protein